MTGRLTVRGFLRLNLIRSLTTLHLAVGFAALSVGAAATSRAESDRATEVAVLLQKAQSEAEAGHFDEAIAKYNAIMSMDVPAPVASLACQNRGNVYLLRGDSARALQDWQEAIRLNPRNAGPYINRAMALFERGDSDGALKDYNEAIRLEPRKYKAFYGRAVTEAQLGEVAAASRDIAQVLKADPKFALAYVFRGCLSVHAKKWKEAEADFKIAENLEPTLPELWAAIADMHSRRRRYPEVIASLHKLLSLRLTPMGRANFLNSLAWIRATSPIQSVRDAGESMRAAREACDISDWQSFPAVDTFAAALAESGDFDNAVQFEWFALSLISDTIENEREGAEKRLHLYEARQPYRDTSGNTKKTDGQRSPKASPTPRSRIIFPPRVDSRGIS